MSHIDTSKAIDVSRLSKEELITELKGLARQCAYQFNNESKFQEAVSQRLPGICATISYCGPMFLGMAMSHHHKGTISF